MLKRGLDYEPDLFELTNCRVQGEVFVDSQYAPARCDAIDFVTKYMQSDLAAEMDKETAMCHNWGAVQLSETFLSQNSVKDFEEARRINDNCLEWIGYLYRYWNRWLGTPSKEIIKEVSAEVACWGYTGLHTLSPRQAIVMLKRRNN